MTPTASAAAEWFPRMPVEWTPVNRSYPAVWIGLDDDDDDDDNDDNNNGDDGAGCRIE